MKKILLSISLLISFIFANKNTTFIFNPFADLSYDIGQIEYNYDYSYKYTGLNLSLGIDLHYEPLFLNLQVSNLLQWTATNQDLFAVLGIGMIGKFNDRSSAVMKLSYANNMQRDDGDGNFTAYLGSFGYYYLLSPISYSISCGFIHQKSWQWDYWNGFYPWGHRVYNTRIFFVSEFTYQMKNISPYIAVGLSHPVDYEEDENYPGFFSIGVQVMLKNFRSLESQTKLMYYKTKSVDVYIFKPNIYIYPESLTQVNLMLTPRHNNKITASIPDYNNGWDVSIEPSGLINNNYQYLFYEGKLAKYPKIKYGWSVASFELWNFIPEKMSELGFNQKEIKDFVDYWQVHLPKSEYYDIFPLINKAVDKEFTLKIEPKPDNVLRVWFYIIPTNQKQDLIPPLIPKFSRNRFTVTEWGVLLNK